MLTILKILKQHLCILMLGLEYEPSGMLKISRRFGKKLQLPPSGSICIGWAFVEALYRAGSGVVGFLRNSEVVDRLKEL